MPGRTPQSRAQAGLRRPRRWRLGRDSSEGLTNLPPAERRAGPGCCSPATSIGSAAAGHGSPCRRAAQKDRGLDGGPIRIGPAGAVVATYREVARILKNRDEERMMNERIEYLEARARAGAGEVGKSDHRPAGAGGPGAHRHLRQPARAHRGVPGSQDAARLARCCALTCRRISSPPISCPPTSPAQRVNLQRNEFTLVKARIHTFLRADEITAPQPRPSQPVQAMRSAGDHRTAQIPSRLRSPESARICPATQNTHHTTPIAPSPRRPLHAQDPDGSAGAGEELTLARGMLGAESRRRLAAGQCRRWWGRMTYAAGRTGSTITVADEWSRTWSKSCARHGR